MSFVQQRDYDVDMEIAKRKKVVECYRSHLEGGEGLQLNPVQENVKCNYGYFPVIFDEKIFGSSRDEVSFKLKENGIGTRKYFYPLTNVFDCFRGIYDANKTPVVLNISLRVLTLPLYADLAMEDVDKICEIIFSCKR